MAFKAQARTWFLRLYKLPFPKGFEPRSAWIEIPGYAFRVHDTTGRFDEGQRHPLDNDHEFEVCGEPEPLVMYTRELHVSFEHNDPRLERFVVKEGSKYMVAPSRHQIMSGFLQKEIWAALGVSH